VMEFRTRIQQGLAAVWKVKGWLVFAVDGSRVALPRTARNEERYAPQSKLARSARKQRRKGKGKGKSRRRRGKQAARQRKANVPQISLTVLWHVGSGLPWDYRTGPSDSSERGHLLEMLSSLPPRSLLTADAGFVGYEFCQRVLDGGHDLLLRVGGNIRLLRKLGYARENEGSSTFGRITRPRSGCRPWSCGWWSSAMAIKGLSADQCVFHQATFGRGCRRDLPSSVGNRSIYRHCKQTFERSKLRSHNPTTRWSNCIGRCWGCGPWGCTPIAGWWRRGCGQSGSASRTCGAPIGSRCENTGACRTRRKCHRAIGLCPDRLL
jgi:hypothetical protein